MAGEAETLGSILDRLKSAESGEQVSVGDVLSALEDRSLGVIVAALGLIAALPVIGAIPGVSIVIAALVVIAIGQNAVGRTGLWAPSFVRDRRIEQDAFDSAIEKARPIIDWVDRRLKPRLVVLTEGAAARAVIRVCAAILAVSMIPLAVVPWGVQAPALGLVALGLALMTRDGAMAAIGYGFAAVTAWVAVALL
jgi:hypothetical protein